MSKKLSTKAAKDAALADMKLCDVSIRVFKIAKALRQYPKEVTINIKWS